MAHWLLQANPDVWRIDDFLAAHGLEELTGWSVTRYLDAVQPHDDVALWVAGPNARVIAFGTATGPARDDWAPDEFWADRERADRPHHWLPIRLTTDLQQTPITRDELRHDPRFAQALILRQPFAGNPFPLTDDQWAAITDRQPMPPPSSHSSATWDLRPGDRIRRTSLHQRYGGPPQGGISPSRTTPNVLIFTDPRSGVPHGYLDEWAPDGSFHYTGRGQRGDQTLTSGNRAILNHAAAGRALRVFQGSGGEVQYIGQFVLDEHDPYDWRTAPSTAGGPPRQVVRFHLRPVDRPPTVLADEPVGSPYQQLDETVEITPPSTPAAVDPDAAGRGVRAHRALQNRLSRLVQAAGYAPLRPTPVDPSYDLAWSTPQALVVVEVKSCTPANEVHQLRMGIGQVLDYEDSLRSRGHSVQPVLYIEQAPADSRWRTLAGQHGILLAWPGTEHELFRPPPS